MIIQVYCVRDLVVGHASIVLTANNEKELRRNLTTFFMQKQLNFVNDHPDDKQVYHVGSFDTVTMSLTPCPAELVCSVAEIQEECIHNLRMEKAKYDGLLTPEQEAEIDGEIEKLENK